MATNQPRRESVSRGHQDKRSPVKFDADMAEGVDPEGAWRFQNSTKFQRTGSTAAQRAGLDPGYVPGYGRVAAGNRPLGTTPKAEFDALFRPILGDKMTPMSGEPMGPPAPGPLPPAATPPPVAPPSPGELSGATPAPSIATTTGAQGVVNKTVQGLPSGQRASSTFVPGQNTKANLAKRTRPPVDPFA